jgi:predicted secreted protein
MNELRSKQLLFFLLAMLTTLVAHADELRYNQVRLQAQQSMPVSNDTMHVTLSTFAEDRDPARLARQINTDMEWALSLAKSEKEIAVSTGNYQTYPVLHKNEHQGWRGQQNLELEGEDTRRISDLVGKLQERLQVKTIRFSVSDRKRHAVENQLIGKALDAFRERAGIIGDNLQASSFRVVNIDVNTATQRPPVPYQARMSSMAMDEAAPVAVEAGESQVTVTVSGTIELQLP